MNEYEDYLTVTSDGLDIDANNLDVNCITSKQNNFSIDSNGNLTVNTITINDSTSNPLSFDAIFNRIYPVGAIYMSTQNINPGSLFTGVWTKIEGRFLLASSNTYQAGSEGGAESVALDITEIPNHTHNIYPYYGGVGNGNALQRGYSTTTTSISYPTSSVGGGQAHNNMPPYLVVHMWKRVS